MNVKNTILTFLFLAFSSIAFCQNYKKEIERDFLDYNNLIIKKDFEKSMAFIPKEFFEVIPKEQMILVMEKTFNNPDVEFELESPKIIEISEVEKIDNKYYSLISYSSLMNMRFLNNDQTEETETEKGLRMNMIKLSLEETFGSGNVQYNEGTDFFEINAQKEAYAVSPNGWTEWKFLVIDKKQKLLLNKLLPKQLADKIL